MSMYSPKIYEDLIPDLYRKAKANGMTMTKLVNTILFHAMKNPNQFVDERFQIESVTEKGR